ncbi:MAG: hypothetical protein Q8R79_06215 [Legionellaceae bacterium]|nr:hypothetical protein [Legionellaceae bacterium]
MKEQTPVPNLPLNLSIVLFYFFAILFEKNGGRNIIDRFFLSVFCHYQEEESRLKFLKAFVQGDFDANESKRYTIF